MRVLALLVLVLAAAPAWAVSSSSVSYVTDHTVFDYNADDSISLVGRGMGEDFGTFSRTDALGTVSSCNDRIESAMSVFGLFNLDRTNGYQLNGFLVISDESFMNPVVSGDFQSQSILFEPQGEYSRVIISGILTPPPAAGSLLVKDSFVGDSTVMIPDWQSYTSGLMTISMDTDAANLDSFFTPGAAEYGWDARLELTAVAAVPEPVTLLSTLAGLGLLARHVRRRVRK